VAQKQQPKKPRAFYSRYGENQGSGIPPPTPHRWYSDPIALFTGFVAVFTLILAIFTGVQVWAYMQSERAYLVAEDLKFVHGVPSTAGDGLSLDLTLRNVGRHIATITGGNVSPVIHVQGGKLPSIPEYFPISASSYHPYRRKKYSTS
jgi:hypothetical protein